MSMNMTDGKVLTYSPAGDQSLEVGGGLLLPGPRLSITVPATSANLGVGFDVMGLALNLVAIFTFSPAKELTVYGCLATSRTSCGRRTPQPARCWMWYRAPSR